MKRFPVGSRRSQTLVNGRESVQLYRSRKALRTQREGEIEREREREREREKEGASEWMQTDECMCDIADA